MASVGWWLEILLVGLLAVTLVHAIRLERALKALRADRAALGTAIAGFDDSAREAEMGFGRLQKMSSHAAEDLARHVEQGRALADDLQFLAERGGTLADRLDELIRSGRPIAQATSVATAQTKLGSLPQPGPSSLTPSPKVRSRAERELLLALQNAR